MDFQRPPAEAKQVTRKFNARCNSCGGKMSPSSVITSCRHLICAGCMKNKETCPCCKQNCRSVQLNSSEFPAEIKERSTIQIEALSSKGSAVCKLQNTHLLEVLERQQMLTQSVYQSLQNSRKKYLSLEHRYRQLREENNRLKRGSGSAPSGFATPMRSSIASPSNAFRCPSVTSTLLGKTLMQA